MIRIVDFLDSKYTQIKDNSLFLKKIKYYSFLRFLIRLYANIFVPFIYKCTCYNNNYVLSEKKRPVQVIVSLTTFPLRVNRLWIVIESILRQKEKPDRIILWLSKIQFSSIDCLPRRLRNMVGRGLEIYFVDNDLKSHKKYFYALTYFSDSILITIDDDLFYPTSLIKDLIDVHNIHRNSVICHRAFSIKFEDDFLQSCENWQIVKDSSSNFLNLFFTSGGGTLFPPHSLHQDVLNSELFKRISFLADDVWLNAMVKLKQTKIYKTNYYSEYIPILYLKNVRLTKYNDHQNGNDLQINQIRNYYQETLNIDPFKIQ